jgi:hypothetical protein
LPVVVEDEEENKLIGIFPFFVRNVFEDFKTNKYSHIFQINFRLDVLPIINYIVLGALAFFLVLPIVREFII